MRRNNHNNRRKTRTGSKRPTRTAPPVYTAGQRETMQAGLRILAKIIARAHLRREASTATREPAVPPPGRGAAVERLANLLGIRTARCFSRVGPGQANLRPRALTTKLVPKQCLARHYERTISPGQWGVGPLPREKRA